MPTKYNWLIKIPTELKSFGMKYITHWLIKSKITEEIP